MDILEELGLSLSYSERNEREERDERDEREERATEKTSENISEKNKGISNGKKSDRVRRVREKVNEVNNEAKLILNSIEPQGSLLEGISSCTGIEYEKLIEQLLNFELSGKVINKHGRYFKSNC
jgi:predicted Rossmann fold nucleotide-binding protein DprA/Smf involved in DNA uptake